MAVHFDISFWLGAAVLASTLVAVFWIDGSKLIIPDWLNAGLALAGGVWILSCEPASAGWRVFEATVAGAVMWAMAESYARLRGLDGLGFGDIKFVAAATMWVGLLDVPWLILFASLTGLLWAVFHIAVGKPIDRLTRLAFGPHLSVALLTVWVLQRFEWL